MTRLLTALRAAVYGITFITLWAWLAQSTRRFDTARGLTLPDWSIALGVACLVAGAVLMLICFAWFVTRGRGTPAPFDPPREFVAAGPYRWVRNPMYIGGLLALIGYGLLERSPSMVLFALAAWLPCHLFVLLVEEPGLERRFAAGYLEYKRRVRRWLPRVP